MTEKQYIKKECKRLKKENKELSKKIDILRKAQIKAESGKLSIASPAAGGELSLIGEKQ